jgi:hypothetical protein
MLFSQHRHEAICCRAVAMVAAIYYTFWLCRVGLKATGERHRINDGKLILPILLNLTASAALQNIYTTISMDPTLKRASNMDEDVDQRSRKRSVLDNVVAIEQRISSSLEPPFQDIPPTPFDPEKYRRRSQRNISRWTGSSDHAIFYNIFINPQAIGEDIFTGDDGMLKAGLRNIRITILEQVEAIHNSSLRNATVFFNLFGKKYDTPSFWCPYDMDCRLMKHQSTGQESDTLQDLYDFCVDHPTRRVTYLHNKGSFSFTASNPKIRRLSNRAVLSDACLSMPLNDAYPCNVCGLKFFFEPHPHTSGNVWTTECSYVRKLIPPMEWEQKRRHMYQQLALQSDDEFSCFTKSMLTGHFDGRGNFNESAGNSTLQSLGLGRYAMEVWMYSHPDVIPCQSILGLLRRYGDGYASWTPKLNRAILYQRRTRIHFDGDQKHNWFQKQGRLWEMRHHYGFEPPQSNPFFYGKLILLAVAPFEHHP